MTSEPDLSICEFHLFVDVSNIAEPLVARARDRAMAVLELELADVRNEREFLDSIGRTFLTPAPVANMDSALSYMSEIDDWMENDFGYVVVITGVGSILRADETLALNLFRILPNVADRWASQQITFQTWALVPAIVVSKVEMALVDGLAMVDQYYVNNPPGILESTGLPNSAPAPTPIIVHSSSA